MFDSVHNCTDMLDPVSNSLDRIQTRLLHNIDSTTAQHRLDYFTHTHTHTLKQSNWHTILNDLPIVEREREREDSSLVLG